MERFQTIRPNDGPSEASRDEALVAHKRFLDSLLNADFMLGTLQGPMLPSYRLSGYVWEHTNTAFLVPSRLLPTGRPQAWWAALNMPDPAAQGSTMHWNLENLKIMPTRQWPTSVTLLPGAVKRIHSLMTATHLNGRVATVLFRDNISNRFAVSLRDIRAFSDATVQVREQNLSCLWWGQTPAVWTECLAGRSLKFGQDALGPPTHDEFTIGDVVFVQ